MRLWNQSVWPGGQRHRLPVELFDDRRLDAPALVEREHRVEAARHDLEAAVGLVGVVDGHHRRDVHVDHRVGGSVLVRRVAGPAGELVVDLLLVEHGRLAEQRAGDLHERTRAQQRAQARVDRHEVLTAAQRRARVGALEVLEDPVLAVGEPCDFFVPADPMKIPKAVVPIQPWLSDHWV